MSVELDWSLATAALAERLKDQLNAALEGMETPEYVRDVHVNALSLGAEEPELEILHLGEVWPEFREATGAASKHSTRVSTPPASVEAMPYTPAASMRLRTFRQYDTDLPIPVHFGSEAGSVVGDETSQRWSETQSDDGYAESSYSASELHDGAAVDLPAHALPTAQLHVGMQWLSHTCRLEISATLQLHYAEEVIVRLPVVLALTGMEMAGQLVAALDGEERCVYLTLCEYDSQRESWRSAGRTRQRIAHILPFLAFASCVGDVSNHVLENVRKVEQFAGDMIRQVLEEELVFPNFYTLDLPE